MACHPARNRSTSKSRVMSLVAAKVDLSQIPSTSCHQSASNARLAHPTPPSSKQPNSEPSHFATYSLSTSCHFLRVTNQ